MTWAGGACLSSSNLRFHIHLYTAKRIVCYPCKGSKKNPVGYLGSAADYASALQVACSTSTVEEASHACSSDNDISPDHHNFKVN